MSTDSSLLEEIISLARAGGAAIMKIYAEDFGVEYKDDASPVTEADARAEAVILEGLARIAPDIPVLAEEAAAAGKTPELGARFFLVDPLDGTREFISKNGEFTVNIALVENGEPVLGVVYAPALGALYAGAKGLGAFRIGEDGARAPIAARTPPASGLIALASRSHRSPETDALLEKLNIAEFAAAGSSLKFCRVAEGAADIYPRLGRTMEWDTGAGQAVLEAAGGRVVVYGSNERLLYGKEERGFDNPHFIAWGAPG